MGPNSAAEQTHPFRYGCLHCSVYRHFCLSVIRLGWDYKKHGTPGVASVPSSSRVTFVCFAHTDITCRASQVRTERHQVGGRLLHQVPREPKRIVRPSGGLQPGSHFLGPTRGPQHVKTSLQDRHSAPRWVRILPWHYHITIWILFAVAVKAGKRRDTVFRRGTKAWSCPGLRW